MANCHNKRKVHTRTYTYIYIYIYIKKKKEEEKNPRLSLGWGRIFFVGWPGDRRISRLARGGLLLLGHGVRFD